MVMRTKKEKKRLRVTKYLVVAPGFGSKLLPLG
jgi:hypothetical protein